MASQQRIQAKRQPAKSGRSRGAQVGHDGRRRHVIQPGDSISEVAELYGVTAQALRELNALANDRIKVGQVLAIPAP